jgi:hypothetical protein
MPTKKPARLGQGEDEDEVTIVSTSEDLRNSSNFFKYNVQSCKPNGPYYKGCGPGECDERTAVQILSVDDIPV